MSTTSKQIEELINALPDDRQDAIRSMREVINENLPDGFAECVSSGMVAWVVPHSLYPAGYHCDPKQPLPFMALASQKGHISLYSMCLYGDSAHLGWFEKEWPKHSQKKLNMGRSCIRFRNAEELPLELIGKLASRVTPQQWIKMYETVIKR